MPMVQNLGPVYATSAQLAPGLPTLRPLQPLQQPLQPPPLPLQAPPPKL
eukprot:gene14507-16011_t